MWHKSWSNIYEVR